MTQRAVGSAGSGCGHAVTRCWCFPEPPRVRFLVFEVRKTGDDWGCFGPEHLNKIAKGEPEIPGCQFAPDSVDLARAGTQGRCIPRCGRIDDPSFPPDACCAAESPSWNRHPQLVRQRIIKKLVIRASTRTDCSPQSSPAAPHSSSKPGRTEYPAKSDQ